jgi:hypothetical protein
MSKIKFSSVMVAGFIVALTSASSFAGGDKPVPLVPTKAITWDEMRDRCAHPEQFDVQRAPQHIRLQCADSRIVWLASMPGEIALPSSRMVTSAVFSDKFFVESMQKDVQILSKNGSCHRFKEVEETYIVERPMSCEEIMGIKGDLGDFCASSLDAAKGTNPKVVDQRDTGRMIDTCGLALEGGNGKPGPK